MIRCKLTNSVMETILRVIVKRSVRIHMFFQVLDLKMILIEYVQVSAWVMETSRKLYTASLLSIETGLQKNSWLERGWNHREHVYKVRASRNLSFYPSLVTEPQGVEGAHRKHFSVWGPGQRRDGIVMRLWRVKQAAKTVPNLWRWIEKGRTKIGQC